MRFSTKLAVLLVAIATIGCDQASKHVAREQLAGRPRQVFLGDTLRLEYAENPGAFLGLGATWPQWVRLGVFIVLTGALLVGITAMTLRAGLSPARRLALAMIAAGGASNLVDRIAYGSVVDFLNVGIGGLRTGIFNVADMAIMMGLLLVFVPFTREPEA